jgi:hypothetical protein
MTIQSMACDSGRSGHLKNLQHLDRTIVFSLNAHALTHIQLCPNITRNESLVYRERDTRSKGLTQALKKRMYKKVDKNQSLAVIQRQR